MAQKISVELTCDMPHETGVGKNRKPVEEPAASSHVIVLDGKAIEIDLCARDAAELDAAFARYREYGRKPARHPGPGHRPRRPVAARAHSQGIRAWAKEQGIDVSERGRVPAWLAARYEAEHGSGSNGNGVPAAAFSGT